MRPSAGQASRLPITYAALRHPIRDLPLPIKYAVLRCSIRDLKAANEVLDLKATILMHEAPNTFEYAAYACVCVCVFCECTVIVC